MSAAATNESSKSSVASSSSAAAPSVAATGKSWAALAKNQTTTTAQTATTQTTATTATAVNNATDATNQTNTAAPSVVASSAAAATPSPAVRPPGKKKNKNKSVNDTSVAAPSADISADSAPAPSLPPALNTVNSSSHSTPSSAISTPISVATSSAAPAPDEQTTASLDSTSPSSAVSKPLSQHNSPSKPKKKGRQNANQNNNPHNNNHLNPNHTSHHAHQQQQQQQQAALGYAPYPYYPQSGHRAPYPSPIPLGANGLPPPEYNASLAALAGAAPGTFPNPYMPAGGYPQQGNGGGKNRNQQQQQQLQFNQMQYYQASPAGTTPTSSSSASASVSSQPSSAPSSSSGYRGGQPFSTYFHPSQYQQQLAYQMQYMYPAQLAAASSSSSNSPVAAGNAANLPVFPVPFATPPFHELLASTSLPYDPSTPYYSVDVECVATGVTHNDRSMAHVAVVDQYLNVVLNLYIKPKKAIVSYLPALTGLSEKDLVNGMTEEEALAVFRANVPRNAVLVGQNILKDVQWLNLIEGQDFASMLDLAGLFATKNPKFSSLTFFSLAHESKALLCLDQTEQHHPAIDAFLSIKLYQLYLTLQQHPTEFERAQKLLLELPVESAFNKKFPVYENVCMGSKKECKCGGAWFF